MHVTVGQIRSALGGLGAGEDPCGIYVDAEIAALESWKASQRNGAPAVVQSAMETQYRHLMLARESCRQRLSIAPVRDQSGPVVQPGQTTEETVSNIRAEADRRASAGDTATAQQLRSTADQIVNQAADDMIRRSQEAQRAQVQPAPTPTRIVSAPSPPPPVETKPAAVQYVRQENPFASLTQALSAGAANISAVFTPSPTAPKAATPVFSQRPVVQAPAAQSPVSSKLLMVGFGVAAAAVVGLILLTSDDEDEGEY